jgi:hypothetical protein
MKKPEAELAIKALCREWRKTCLPDAPEDKLYFTDFHSWLLQRHPEVLRFRSVVSPVDEAERWFDNEFGQSWRN